MDINICMGEDLTLVPLYRWGSGGLKGLLSCLDQRAPTHGRLGFPCADGLNWLFAIPLHRILYLRLRCLDDMYYGVGLIDLV